MTAFYRKIPVLDEKEQAMFDKYLREEYFKDIRLARIISLKPENDLVTEEQYLAFQTILDKLATPRIYLLREWIHQRAQKEATKDEGWKEHPEDENK